jgi:hypothetical protein
MSDEFAQKAPVFMARLMQDIGCTAIQAAGVFGNAGRESGGFRWHHELGKPDGQGGYGWFQWTGPRRVDFFAFCKANKLDPVSDEASYRFLVHELKGKEARTVAALKACKSLGGAAAAFEQSYERAGVKALSDRVAWAQRALAAYDDHHGTQFAAKVNRTKLARHAAKHSRSA